MAPNLPVLAPLAGGAIADDSSALSAFVGRLGHSPAVFESSRANAVWPLVSQLLEGLARGLVPLPRSAPRAAQLAARRLCVRLTESGLGLRFGDALKAHATFLRLCVSQRCESLQLPLVYPALRAGLRHLWLALLRRGSEVRLAEQLLLGNVVEGLVSDWLPDETSLDTSGTAVASRAFAELDGAFVLRNEVGRSAWPPVLALLHHRRISCAYIFIYFV